MRVGNASPRWGQNRPYRQNASLKWLDLVVLIADRAWASTADAMVAPTRAVTGVSAIPKKSHRRVGEVFLSNSSDRR